MNVDDIKAAFLGLAIGDALGVPVEFKSRMALDSNPVKTMLEYGCWNQPKGTWSDDSSLTFCLADSLCGGYNLNDIAQKMLLWYQHAYMTAHGEVFDVGGTTRHALMRLIDGCLPTISGNMFESDNGNGSLMRILPLAFYLQHEEDLAIIYSKAKEVSAITHAHFRSVYACFIYVVYLIELIQEKDKHKAYSNMQKKIIDFTEQNQFNKQETNLFSKIIKEDIAKYTREEIKSDGYVLHTLEASLWCMMNTDNYEDAVLKAVNLGGDTDTTACVTGGMAGFYYGIESIPIDWKITVVKREQIEQMSIRFYEALIN